MRRIGRVVFMVGAATAAMFAACTDDDDTNKPLAFDAGASFDATSDRSVGTDATPATDSAPQNDAATTDAPADAKDGGPELVTSGLGWVKELTVVGSRLYWVEGSQQYQEKLVRTCTVDACTPTTLADESSAFVVQFLTGDGTAAYYTRTEGNGTGRVVKADVATADGGAGAVLSNEGTEPWAIAVGPTGLYWASAFSGDVVHCDPANCAATRKVIGNAGPRVMSVRVSDGGLYWVGEGNPSTQSFVATCNLPECDGGVTTLMYPGHNSRQLRVAGSHFYFLNLDANFNPFRYEVRGCPLAGCPDAGPAPLFSSDKSIATETQTLAANSSDVYWVANNAVVSCPPEGCDGGPANVHIPFGKDASAGANVAADEAYVYYATAGEIWRAPK